MSSSLSDSSKVSSRDSRHSLTWVILLLVAGSLAVVALLWLLRPENEAQTTVQSSNNGEAAVVVPSGVTPCETGCLDDYYAEQYAEINRESSVVTSRSATAAVAAPRSVAPCETGCLDDFYAEQYGGLKTTELSGAGMAATINAPYATYTDRYWALAQAWESKSGGVDELNTIPDRHTGRKPRRR